MLFVLIQRNLGGEILAMMMCLYNYRKVLDATWLACLPYCMVMLIHFEQMAQLLSQRSTANRIAVSLFT